MKPQDSNALQVLRTALGSAQFVASLTDHHHVQNALAHLEQRLTPKPKAAKTPPPPSRR